MTQQEVSGSQPHMLDGCDPQDCYKTMMTERTDLIKARREAEDNLVKTIVQISATLIALIAGFATQTSASLIPSTFPLLVLTLGLLVASLSFGLAEHVFSSKAYLAQQQLVERFYTKQINGFDEPWANKWVRRCQIVSFGCFVVALIALGSFGIFQAGEKSHGKSTTTTTTAAAAAAAATSSAPPTGQLRRQSIQFCNEVGCSKYAPSSPQEELKR